ncbi:MAG: FAD-dependent oxidoreductase [Methanotrichaceae archaeon]
MEKYDVIVVGSGAGMRVASNALQKDMKVAVIDHGLMGGTCLNNGCLPLQDADLSCRCNKDPSGRQGCRYRGELKQDRFPEDYEPYAIGRGKFEKSN